MRDYYQVLGLSRSATQEDIRKAYLHYASKFHPDKHNGDPFFAERFKELKEAYEILNDFEERWRYDIRKFKKSKAKRHQILCPYAKFSQIAIGLNSTSLILHIRNPRSTYVTSLPSFDQAII